MGAAPDHGRSYPIYNVRVVNERSRVASRPTVIVLYVTSRSPSLGHRVERGHTVPWSFLVTGPRPL